MKSEDQNSSFFAAPLAILWANQHKHLEAHAFSCRTEFSQWYLSLPEVRDFWQIFDPESLLSNEYKMSAFCHSSFCNEWPLIAPFSHERLEHLGDAVLGLCVADLLFSLLPDSSEGELSQLRRAIVSGESCSTFAKLINLKALVLLGKGQLAGSLNGNQFPESIEADVFEALLGALYLGGGIKLACQALEICWNKFQKENSQSIIEFARHNILDPKSQLQQLSLGQYKSMPDYKIEQWNKSFVAVVKVGDQIFAQGEGPNKKQAELAAATNALKKINQLNNSHQFQAGGADVTFRPASR